MTPRSLLAPARLGGQPILRAQTDDRLVDLARSGSRPAFEAIVARYRRPLVTYSARFLGAERAEDAVQQTFVKAYTALTAGEAVRNLRPWLYRIAHNTSLNMLRDRSLAHEPLSEEIDGVERPDQAAERRQELARVLTAVKSLPDRQRDAIVLRAIEGRSYEQIAESLGVTDGAVRQLLSRARCGVRAGVAAVTPVGLLARIAAPFGDVPATVVAAGGSGGGGGFAAGKLCAAALAAAIAGGGATTLPDAPRERAAGSGDAVAATPKSRTVAVSRPAASAAVGLVTAPTATAPARTRPVSTRRPASTPRADQDGRRAPRRADSERGEPLSGNGRAGTGRPRRDEPDGPRDGSRELRREPLEPVSAPPAPSVDGSYEPRRSLDGPRLDGTQLDGAHTTRLGDLAHR